MVLLKKIIKKILSFIPPFTREKVIMALMLRYIPDIKSPTTFNEKIAHRKLLEYDERFHVLSDKLAVRQYVKNKVGDTYLTNLIGRYNNTNEINFKKLPNKFVVKPNHDSKSTIVVDNKMNRNINELKKKLKKSLNNRPTFQNEYWYLEIEPKLIIEERLIDDKYDIPLDYKFYVFHGKVELIQVDLNRYGKHQRNLYNRGWDQLDVEYLYKKGPNIKKPKLLERMIEVSEKLAVGIDFVRVDLYCVNDERIVFGEMTFAPEGGRRKFKPNSFDFELGAKW